MIPTPDRPTPLADHLTDRERQVIGLIAQGLSNREISETISCSENSVKSFVRSAYQKIGVERRANAVVWALHHGLVGDDGGIATASAVPGSPR